MAKEHRPEKSIQDLRQEIAHSRDRLARDLAGLRYELDFPLKFRKSFQRHTATWVSAAVLSGVAVTARLAGRKKTVVVDAKRAWRWKEDEEKKKGIFLAGLSMAALRFGATLLKPIVVSFVTRKLGGYATRSR